MAKNIPTINNDKLTGTTKNDSIDGLDGNDTITGEKGNDNLHGGFGADSMDGGAGNDTLFGEAGNDTLIGGAGADVLDGGDDNDKLIGGSGADTLIGGAGIDTLIGGDMNDVYIVDNNSDVITETSSKTSGLDSVFSSVDYTLSANVENLTLTGISDLKGTGNASKNLIIGNDGANVLNGAAGSDTLKGGSGDDTLIGGAGVDQLIGGDGSDTYPVDSTEDKIIETASGGDEDVVESSVSYTLGANLEVLTLVGVANINGIGNELANRLEGNAGANRLQGEAGDDTLFGGSGNDTLQGGAGDDVINGGEGIDQVTYPGNQNDYTMTFDAQSAAWVVEDINGAVSGGVDEGRDTLTGVESVVFADKRVVDLTQGLTLSINNLSQPEGTGADSRFNFTVSLSAASTAPVSVNYRVEGGTATVDTDFSALSGVLTFAPNETQKTLSVSVKADSQVENDETFSVVLSNPVGASLVQAKGNGTIQNDDLAVISVASLSIKEGNSGTQDALLTVSLSTPITQTVTVNYATADGTALADSDYTRTTGQVTFTPGSTRQTIKIPVIGDSVVEADERFQVLLTNPLNAVLDATSASATVTLVNDDQITLQISSDKQYLKAGQSAALTFAFSDAPKGFETGDIQVSGGRVENVVAAPDGKTYTARFVPAENQNSVNGLVSVAAGSYTDTQGKAGIASNSLTFTGDTLAPSLGSSTPADNATDIAIGSNLVLNFSESVKAGTGNIIISNGTDTRTINAGDTSQVSFSGTSVTINPTQDLQFKSNYYIRMDNGVIVDTNGNAYAGITNSTTLNFSTLDGVQTVDVTKEGSFDVSKGDFILKVLPGNYLYTVSGFGKGDKIDFPADTDPTVFNDSYTDRVVDVLWESKGISTTIRLTGLTTQQDASLNFIPDDFNTIFGTGSIF